MVRRNIGERGPCTDETNLSDWILRKMFSEPAVKWKEWRLHCLHEEQATYARGDPTPRQAVVHSTWTASRRAHASRLRGPLGRRHDGCRGEWQCTRRRQDRSTSARVCKWSLRRSATQSLSHLPLACPYRGELCSSHMPESGRKAPCGIASADHNPTSPLQTSRSLFADYFPAYLYSVLCGANQCPSSRIYSSVVLRKNRSSRRFQAKLAAKTQCQEERARLR